jgi:hypothetical protein
LVNLAGGWSNNGMMGVRDAMYDTYNYPQDNQGGNAGVVLRHVPSGEYHIYIYGHESYPQSCDDYTLYLGSRELGRKQTVSSVAAIDARTWEEGVQYVKFSDVPISEETEVRIFIRPGASGACDSLINGLQLVPVLQSRP